VFFVTPPMVCHTLLSGASAGASTAVSTGFGGAFLAFFSSRAFKVTPSIISGVSGLRTKPETPSTSAVASLAAVP
jgi:hypothetical protein